MGHFVSSHTVNWKIKIFPFLKITHVKLPRNHVKGRHVKICAAGLPCANLLGYRCVWAVRLSRTTYGARCESREAAGSDACRPCKAVILLQGKLRWVYLFLSNLSGALVHQGRCSANARRVSSRRARGEWEDRSGFTREIIIYTTDGEWKTITILLSVRLKIIYKGAAV